MKQKLTQEQVALNWFKRQMTYREFKRRHALHAKDDQDAAYHNGFYSGLHDGMLRFKQYLKKVKRYE